MSGESKVAAELREAFDRSFASPRAATGAPAEDLLMIRVGDAPYAVRVSEIAGIVAGRAIAHVPAAAPGLLGMAGVRGDVVPVFGLASLLGGEDVEAARWIVLAGGHEPVGLAFSALDGLVRLPSSALHAAEKTSETRRFVTAIAVTDAGQRPVISVSLVVESIRQRRAPRRQEREQW